jgi:hypothetical protein
VRETPRLRVNTVEPRFNPGTGLSCDSSVLRLLNESGATGVCYDERGKPMLGSTMVRDPEFQDRVVAETRALLSTVSA